MQSFALGRLHSFAGIAEGAENSNFFVSLDAGNFVLTLVERGARSHLPFTVALLERLQQAGLPVPFAVRDQQGEAVLQLAGKPALLQPRLVGKHILKPDRQHCAEVGTALARMHLATAGAVLEHPSDRGLAWMLEQGSQQAIKLAERQRALLKRALRDVQALQLSWSTLPQANLHADLFRDNVLFDGPQLSGVIDFHNACSGPMLYDVAIAVNDWCCASDKQLDEDLTHALLSAYGQLRPFSPAEAHQWEAFLRVGCLRFWLSRLLAAQTAHHSGVQIKPPEEFEQRLIRRQTGQISLPLAL